MRIAGRCFCGFAMELVAKKPDQHMRCFGLRWCRKCGDAAVAGKRCEPCRSAREAITLYANPYRLAKKRAYHRAWVRKALRDPRYRYLHNKYSRQSAERARKANAPAYQREKERKRLRYQNDPAYAEMVKAKYRQRYHDQKQRLAVAA